MAGIPWGIGRDSIAAVMESRGYNLNRTDDDGDMWFDGMLRGIPTRVFAFMASDSLVKLRMRVITRDEQALAMYDTLRSELIKQYGAPEESARAFQPPYAKGKGEQDAVRAGKASIRSHWLTGSGSRKSHVAVRVERELVVVIDHEGPSWNREYRRRGIDSGS